MIAPEIHAIVHREANEEHQISQTNRFDLRLYRRLFMAEQTMFRTAQKGRRRDRWGRRGASVASAID